MKNKYFIFTIPFILLLLITPVSFIILKPARYSESERRVLKQKPELKVESLISGKYMSDFEDYSLDQFPFREKFRQLKVWFCKNILLEKDINKFYEYSGYLIKMEYPLNSSRINNSINQIKTIEKLYLENSRCRIYISLIPDKNIFAAEKSGHLAVNFTELKDHVCNSLPSAEYISIYELLKLEDYYRTDQHWKQENIIAVAKKLVYSMNGNIDEKDYEFKEQHVTDIFYGTYYGQAQLKVKPDNLFYLENEYTKTASVKSFNTGKGKDASVYNLKKAEGRDPYEMFLEGSDALLTIENPLVKNNKELIVFRDSFSSSLVPLMLSGYRKITLVDLRYIQPGLLKNYIEFSDQDILFLYSTLVL